MVKNATIYFYADPDSDAYTAVFNGTATFALENVTLEYRESEDTVMQITAMPGMVSINRIGTIVYTLILEPEKSAVFLVKTPYGEFTLSVTPTDIYTHCGADELDIRIAYALKAEDTVTDMFLRFRCELTG